MAKHAVVSIDIEDWYHTYFADTDVNKDISLLDGLDVILRILNEQNIKASFFVVGEIAESIASKLQDLDRLGHDIACHNWQHFRPIDLSADEFKLQLIKSKGTLENILGHSVSGYRAPSFGINNGQFEIMRNFKFNYDSSMLKPQKSKKYGTLRLDNFEEVAHNIYKDGDFTEFEVSTQKVGSLNILLGGGYLRMLPWFVIKPLIKRYLKSRDTYVMYIHPIDMSNRKIPKVKNIGLDRFLRTRIGRKHMEKRFKSILKMLKKNDFEFVTFEELRKIKEF